PAFVKHAAQYQIAYDGVDADAPYGRYARTADGLLVGHDRQSFQRCLTELTGPVIGYETLDGAGELIACIQPPAARHFPERKAPVLVVIIAGQRLERGMHLLWRTLDGLRQPYMIDWLVGGQSDGFRRRL